MLIKTSQSNKCKPAIKFELDFSFDQIELSLKIVRFKFLNRTALLVSENYRDHWVSFGLKWTTSRSQYHLINSTLKKVEYANETGLRISEWNLLVDTRATTLNNICGQSNSRGALPFF